MGLISGMMKAGSTAGINKDVQYGFGDPNSGASQTYDPNAKFYNGSPTGRQDYTNEMRLRQGGADRREAPVANYGQANAAAGQAALARGGQQQAANLMLNRATGATPSIAGQQSAQDIAMLQQNAARQMQQGQAAQAAQASSARGAAGVALAGQQAANNTANLQGNIGTSVAQSTQNISNQAQINAANERLQAEQAALGGFGNIRGGDLASQDLESRNAQFQAQQQLASRNANDARAMGYEGLIAGANQAQLNASMQDQGIKANSYNAAMGHNAAASQANANRSAQQADGLADDVGGFFDSAIGGAMMLSDTRAKQQTLLARGRAQGAAMAGGADPSDVAAIRDPRSIDALLDDRYQQNAVGPETVGRGALDEAIGRQVQADKYSRFDSVDDPLPVRADDPTAQWERSFGSSKQAAADARTRDNLVEAQKIRAGFARDDSPSLSAGGQRAAGQPPWWTQKVSGLFDSDARAKEEARLEGIRQGQEMVHRQQADELEQSAIKYGALGATPAAPLALPIAATQAIRMTAADAEADRARRKPSKREPRSGSAEGAKGMILTTGADHEGVASRDKSAGLSGEEALNRPSDLRTPYDMSVHYAEPQRTPGAIAAEQSVQRPDTRSAIRRFFDSDERAKVKPDGGPVAEANRAMRGEPYTYRPEHTPPNEQAGQPHFGFMAQNLEQSPVSRVAVEEGPDGMKRVDRDRMLQVVAAGVADLQRQQDETRLALRKGGRR